MAETNYGDIIGAVLTLVGMIILLALDAAASLIVGAFVVGGLLTGILHGRWAR